MITELGDVHVVPVSAVKPYPGNPRKVSQKAIAQCAVSIREFGWQQPLVVDRNMVIVAGHTRYSAAKHLKLVEVPVVVADQLNEDQVRAFRIADNRTHDYTTWNYSQLVGELDDLAPMFAEVLDLADWEDVIRQFETAKEESGLDLDTETSSLLSGQYVLTVVFDSQESAERAAPGVLDIPGVVNVRYSGR